LSETTGKDSKSGGVGATTTTTSGATGLIPPSTSGGWLASSASSSSALSSGSSSVASISGTGSVVVAPSRAILKNIRICSLTEEVPREFKIWAWRSFGSKKDEDEEYTPPKDMLKLAFGVLRKYVIAAVTYNPCYPSICYCLICLHLVADYSFLELGREIQGWSEEKTHDFLTLYVLSHVFAVFSSCFVHLYEDDVICATVRHRNNYWHVYHWDGN
jgi:hypothetical protein